MKVFVFLTCFFFLAAGLADVPAADGRRPLPELISVAEYREYQRKTRYRDRMKLFRKIIDRDVDLLADHTKNWEIDEVIGVLKGLRDISAYVKEEAAAATNPRDLRSNDVKRLEIRLRKLVERVDELRRAVPFEYREEFEITTRAMEELRNQLLIQLFGRSIKPAEETSRLLPGAFLLTPVMGFAQMRNVSQIQGDRFTEEEFAKIQERQDLAGRVDVFLKIAASRLEEIDRRRNGKEWKDKKENPLEFHSYAEMIHAYDRAIRGIMINIDEKAQHRTATEKDIRKALEKLNKDIQEFIPQLAPLKDFAVERRDEPLYRELEKAEKTSEMARKGSLLGLGAPAQ
jgi:hypothetical protein